MYKFVVNEKVVYVDKISSIVIGDIHFGIEKEYLKKGIHLPDYYSILLSRVNKLIKKFSAKRLIFLGDIKHDIGKTSLSVEKKIRQFFSSLRSSEIYIVKGNHDGGLKRILTGIENVTIFTSRGFSIKDYGFFHGNSWPHPNVIKSKIAFCSHLHPKLKLPDDSKRFEQDVFLVCRPNNELLKKIYKTTNLREIVVLPPINNYVGGIELNEWGGILKKMCLFSGSEIYSSDGTYVGALE